MTNLERLLTIQANGDTSWLNGAHYVLNNFMPKWVRFNEGFPNDYNPVLVVVSDYYRLAYRYDNKWFDSSTDKIIDVQYNYYLPIIPFIPQPPNE